MDEMFVGGKPKSLFRALARLFKETKGRRLFLLFAVITAAVFSVVAIITPSMISELTNDVIMNARGYYENPTVVPFVVDSYIERGIVLIILYLISAIFLYLSSLLVVVFTVHPVCKNLRTKMNKKINKLPLKYFDAKPYGDVLSRETNDIDTIIMSCEECSVSIIVFAIMLVGLPIAMFMQDWRLTLIVFATIPVSLLLLGFVSSKSQKYFRGQQEKLGKVNGYIEEMYAGQTVVKAFNAEKRTKKEFDKYNNELYNDVWKAQFISGNMMPIMSFVGNVGYAVILGVGGIFAMKSSNPATYIGTILAFIIYLRLFNQQFGQFGQIMAMVQSAGAASERVFEFLDEEEMEEENHKTAILENVKGDIEFKNVSFGYVPEKTIIHDFSASVKAGSKVAIVGPTGAGKTTMVNLLMRFYEINSGSITIDGIDIRDLTRTNIHDVFGMVLQDTWLLEGTVKQNLMFGNNPNITDEQIKQAAKASYIHHYIKSLPKGYDTVLDEATSISQGQKQLFTIARAMVENAPMLILDEATSNVDTRTEVLIQKAMDELMKGRTSFVIAHRLSTIKDADMILVMNEGNIVEVGNHKELLEKNGFYAELYNSQFTCL